MEPSTKGQIAKRPPVQFFAPAVDRWTEPFWAAAREHRLVAPRCAACGTFRMPPTPFCRNCRSQEIDWTPLPGTGSLYSYTVVARAILPGMDESLPYVPAVVALDGAGDARLISNVVDVPIDALSVGLPLRVVWDDDWGGFTVPRFTATA
jgi:uncharacterized OB-fold protein